MVFWRVVLLFCGVALMVGCHAPKSQARQRVITIYAAASLTDVVTALKRDFEAAHPNTRVEPVFAGSHILRTQLEQGARADVLMSAHRAHVQSLKAKQIVSHMDPLLYNRLVVAVPKDSPLRHWRQIRQARRVVVGLAQVPVGDYARQLLAQQGEQFKRDVLARVVSQEVDARTVLMRVHTGQADAAVVYQTDIQPHHQVKALAIPPSDNVRASYYVGVLRPEVARPWLAHLKSARGRQIIKQHGFMTL